MVLKILSFSSNNTELFNKAMSIRFEVFSGEQNIDKDIEFDGLDYGETVHYLVTVDDKPVATLRWRETDEGIKIERMAVLKQYRHLAIGMLLLRYVLQELKNAKTKIYLHAQQQVVDFYKKNHFKVASEVFYEANIPHVKMIYEK